ncbi:hypothetical protein V8E36_008684 [Tilletia maclaganii]
MARTKVTAEHRSQQKGPAFSSHTPSSPSKQRPSTSTFSGPATCQQRARPGEAVLRDIRRYQRSTEHLLPSLAFQRLVREITQGFTPPDARKYSERMWYEGYRYTSKAMEALQDGAEQYIVEILQDCNLAAQHAGQVTIMPVDIKLVLRLGHGRL